MTPSVSLPVLHRGYSYYQYTITEEDAHHVYIIATSGEDVFGKVHIYIVSVVLFFLYWLSRIAQERLEINRNHLQKEEIIKFLV